MELDAMTDPAEESCERAIRSLARMDGFRVTRLELAPLPRPVEEPPRPPAPVRVQTVAEFIAGTGKRGKRK